MASSGAAVELGTPVFQTMLGAVLDRMAEEKQRPIEAVPTPFPSWNRVCRSSGGSIGLARGWHIVVGARSSAGKSLVGANLAVTAIRAGVKVGILSLEMSDIEFQTRIMSIAGRVRANDLEHGPNFRPLLWEQAKAELHRIHDATEGCVYMNHSPIRNLADVEDSIRWLHDEWGVGYFIVDYLQLAAVGQARDILDRVTEVSMVVRGLAKELNVTTVGMSQLNRQASTMNETPRKEGLMGGSPLENDADQVLLLDHSRIDRTPGGVAGYAVLDKNRHGPAVEFPTFFDTSTLEMRERMA